VTYCRILCTLKKALEETKFTGGSFFVHQVSISIAEILAQGRLLHFALLRTMNISEIPTSRPQLACSACQSRPSSYWSLQPHKALTSGPPLHPGPQHALYILPSDSNKFGLLPYTLTANEIASLQRTLLDRPITPIQQGAVEKFRILYASLKSLSRKQLCSPERPAFDLRPFFELFDDILFSSMLKDFVRVEWIAPNPYFLGILNASPDKAVVSVICVPLQNPKWPDRSLEDFLDTLLHEMAHALFAVYKCHCRVCECEINLMTGEGVTGHGPAWWSIVGAVRSKAGSILGKPRHRTAWMSEYPGSEREEKQEYQRRTEKLVANQYAQC